MVIEDQLQQIVEELVTKSSAQLVMDLNNIQLSLAQDAEVVHLKTLVYHGAFIPFSVRKSLNLLWCMIPSNFKTKLEMNEDKGEIYLYGYQYWDMSEDQMKNLLDDFYALAEEWKYRLDEKGREDLVYIYHKR